MTCLRAYFSARDEFQCGGEFVRRLTSALLLAFIAASANANETLQLDGMAPKSDPNASLPVCENNPYDKSNCVRALACLGTEGVYFDGQAHGWDTGIVIGFLDDGTSCTGEWMAGDVQTHTPGRASLVCENGVEANVLYHTLDNETGTVIGSGQDSLGREITVWSGEKVLQFLTDPEDDRPVLPCGPAPIPIS
jgi:hypothetical protein